MKNIKEDSRFKFFCRLVSLPYLLVLLALAMPLMNVSCSENQTIASPSLYQVASGMDLHQSLEEPAKSLLLKLEKENPKSLDKFKMTMPDFPQMPSYPFLYAIAGALALAMLFAWLSFLGPFTHVASLTMGMLTMVSLWSLLSQCVKLCQAFNLPMLRVEPGVGLYCASALILVGTAMNLACIIRPILAERKAKKAPLPKPNA